MQFSDDMNWTADLGRANPASRTVRTDDTVPAYNEVSTCSPSAYAAVVITLNTGALRALTWG